MATRLSNAALIVLRELDRADGKAVLKAAIKELVAADAWRINASPAKRKRRARTTMLLTPGGQRPPREAPLPRVSQLIEATPPRAAGGTIRDLRDVAKDIAKSNRNIRKELVREVLEDLAAAGLVEREQRRVLGIFPRTRYARTVEGDQQLGDEAAARDERGWRRRGDPTPYAGGAAGAYVGAESAGLIGDTDQGDDAGTDPDVDSGLDAGLDSAFDSSFDSAFDASFDSAFDSGFDAGGGGDGGFGGGDGGGGGGDGGGGGGG
jgi:uncharacterized membrane protein YgcG